MVTSECEPFAKTGGLADVVDALSRALGSASPAGLGSRRGRLPALVPRPRAATTPRAAARRGRPVGGAATEPVTIWTGQADGYRLRLVEHAPVLRPRRATTWPTGATTPTTRRASRCSGAPRSRPSASRARPVDIVHGHDWEAGPALLALALERAADRRDAAGDRPDVPQPRLPRLDAARGRVAARPARLDRRRLGRRRAARGDRRRGPRQHGQPHVRARVADARARPRARRRRSERAATATSGSSTASTPSSGIRPRTRRSPATYSATDLARQGGLSRRTSARATASTRTGRCSASSAGSTPRRASTSSPTPRRALLAEGARSIVLGTGDPALVAGARRAGRGATRAGSRSSTASIVTRRAGSTRAPTCSSCPRASSPAARAR